MLSNPASPSQALVVGNVKASAQSMGLALQWVEARAPAEFDRAFALMDNNGAEALLVVSDSLFGTYAVQLGQLAMKHRLPSIHGARSNVQAGACFCTGRTFRTRCDKLPCTWTGF